MVLTYDAYTRTLEENPEKQNRMSAIEERILSMESLMQNYFAAAQKMDPTSRNQFAQKLFESGVYKREI